MIATIDANVLVSGTLFGGSPGRIIDAAVDRQFTLALSPSILSGYENVLSRSKFGLAAEAVEVLVRDMESHALVVYPSKAHQIVAEDPDDDAIVDCAVEAKADTSSSWKWDLCDDAGQLEAVTMEPFGSIWCSCAKARRRSSQAFLYRRLTQRRS